MLSTLEPMPFHSLVPFFFLRVEIPAGGVNPGMSGVALQKLETDPGIGLVGNAGMAKPVS